MMLQLAAGMELIHESDGVPENPFIETTCRLKFAVWPASTVADVLPPAAACNSKSVAVPLSCTACWGLPAALSVTLKTALRVPAAVGLKFTSISHAEPGATLTL